MAGPAFRLEPPAPESAVKEWRLIAEFPQGCGLTGDDVVADLAEDEIRLSSRNAETGGPRFPVCYRIPPGGPVINVATAVCSYSRRLQRLSISWQEKASTTEACTHGPQDVADLDARIAALRQECLGLAEEAKSGSAADERDQRLARTVAAQVSKLHSGNAGGGAEHLAQVVDTALEVSGHATSPLERGRLLLEVAKAIAGKNAAELRARCFDRAVEVLDEVSGSQALALRVQALLRGGLACKDIGQRSEAEMRLQAVIDLSSSPESRAAAHGALAEVCMPSSREATQHREAAEQILSRLREERLLKAAEAAHGFAAEGAERLPLRRYTFLDEEKHAIIRVSLDEALFPGASSFVTSRAQHLKFAFDAFRTKGGRQALELQVAAPSSLGPLGCWVLRLAPLYREVVEDATEVRLRRNFVELRLLKREPGPWHDGPTSAQ